MNICNAYVRQNPPPKYLVLDSAGFFNRAHVCWNSLDFLDDFLDDFKFKPSPWKSSRLLKIIATPILEVIKISEPKTIVNSLVKFPILLMAFPWTSRVFVGFLKKLSPPKTWRMVIFRTWIRTFTLKNPIKIKGWCENRCFDSKPGVFKTRKKIMG